MEVKQLTAQGKHTSISIDRIRIRCPKGSWPSPPTGPDSGGEHPRNGPGSQISVPVSASGGNSVSTSYAAVLNSPISLSETLPDTNALDACHELITILGSP